MRPSSISPQSSVKSCSKPSTPGRETVWKLLRNSAASRRGRGKRREIGHGGGAAAGAARRARGGEPERREDDAERARDIGLTLALVDADSSMQDARAADSGAA